MPTYEFLHDLTDCKHEWEEELSIKASDPIHCPKCNAEGNITRLISGGSGRGIVELYGDELVKKCREDAQNIKKDAAQSEKMYANLLGEAKMESLQQRFDKQKRR